MREKDLIKKSYWTIAYYCGLICLTVGALPLLPLLALPFFPMEFKFIHWFLIPSLSSILLGAIIYFLTRNKERITISVAHSAVIVVFLWLYGCLLGGVPFVFAPQFNYLHGLFESVSGWTTTGLTVVNTDEVPNLLLLWRSIMQYIGGAGFAVVMLSILSGPSASGIYQAEGHGDEILPQVKQSAIMVWSIYVIYLVIGVALYTLVGMPVFDSINHAMTALATGGFSTKNASIGFYNSAWIDIVTIILMLLGHMNFATHHLIFQAVAQKKKEKWKAVWKNAEMKSSTWMILIFVPITFLFVTMALYNPVKLKIGVNMLQYIQGMGLPLRRAAFEAVSALTGTGFSTVAYTSWSSLGVFIIIFLMCAGGQTGSTSGGIKQYRIYLMAMSLYWSAKEQFLPPTAVVSHSVFKGEKLIYIKPRHIRELANYVVVYVMVFIIGSAILMGCGFPVKESMFEFASALGTVGLSMGITSVSSSPAVLLTEIFGMFLGRLEFFVIVYCFVKIFRDIEVVASKEV